VVEHGIGEAQLDAAAIAEVGGEWGELSDEDVATQAIVGDGLEHDDVVAEAVEQLGAAEVVDEVLLDAAAEVVLVGLRFGAIGAPEAPRLLVKMMTVSLNQAVSPRPSVRRPSSRICRNLSRTRPWAFSISSNRRTRTGER
jgi:hypothetical protein